METSKELEMPRGLNDCTLTDINLLREWLANVCGTSEGGKSESRDDQDVLCEEAA